MTIGEDELTSIHVIPFVCSEKTPISDTNKNDIDLDQMLWILWLTVRFVLLT